MQIQSTQNYQANQPAFQSRFVRNTTLRKAFRECQQGNFVSKEEDQFRRQFLNAVKGLLNDGKDDVIKLTENGGETYLYVNGKRIAAQGHFVNPNQSAEGTRNAIITFAQEERGIKKVYDFDTLSQEEKTVAKEALDGIEQLKPEQKDYQSSLSRLKDKIEYEVNYYVIKELKRLETEMFKRK